MAAVRFTASKVLPPRAEIDVYGGRGATPGGQAGGMVKGTQPPVGVAVADARDGVGVALHCTIGIINI